MEWEYGRGLGEYRNRYGNDVNGVDRVRLWLYSRVYQYEFITMDKGPQRVTDCSPRMFLLLR